MLLLTAEWRNTVQHNKWKKNAQNRGVKVRTINVPSAISLSTCFFKKKSQAVVTMLNCLMTTLSPNIYITTFSICPIC